MAALATILCALGIIGLVWGVMQKMKAARLNSAPFASTGDVAQKGESVAGPKGAISAQGKVVCPAPLLSPVTGTPCLYYELKIVGEWKDGDSSKSKDYLDQKEAAAFSIDDGSGAVAILAASGGDFDDLAETFKETKKAGFFADLKNAVGKGKPIVFGKYEFENPVNSKADKFTCIEKVLKVEPQLFALGKYESGTITTPSFRSLVLSKKTRDELFGAATKAAKQFIYGGAAVAVVGVILGLVSQMGKGEERSAAASGDAAKVEALKADSAKEGAAKVEAPSDSGAAPATGSAECAKAKACCEALNGDGFAACQNYTKVPGMACASSLEGFKKAVSFNKPDKLSACE